MPECSTAPESLATIWPPNELRAGVVFGGGRAADVTDKSRSSEDESEFAPVDSDGFIDAVLEQAESTVAVRRRRRMLEQRSARRVPEVAVDMIDGEVLAAAESDEIVVDLTDDAQPAPEPPTNVEPSLVETKAHTDPPSAPTPERKAATASLQAAVADSTPPPNRAPVAPASAPVVDFRGVVAPSAPVVRRGRSLRRLRHSFREYMIRRGSGAPRLPLITRWRKARLRRTREQRRAATLAALQGQDPTEVRVSEPSMAGYVAAVVVVAVLAVVVLIVLL